MKPFKQGIHYYLDGSRVVFTALYLIQREKCCGNGCRHCPFDPQHERGNVVVAEEFIKFIDKEDKNGSE